MNIGIMTTNTDRQLVGIPRVTHDTMKEVLKQDKTNQYFLIKGKIYDLPQIEDDSKWRLDGFLLKGMDDFLCKLYGIDVIYSFYPEINISVPCKKVLTIHDMIPLLFPQWFNVESYERFNVSLRKSAIEADRIIAMSENTKRDIVNSYGVDEKKIEVVYSGIQPKILDRNVDIDVEKQFGISGPYILSVCTIEPRKNLKGLIDAFLTYKSRHPQSDLKLVLTGRNGWNAEIVEIIQQHERYCDDIIRTGFVSEEELAVLMRKSLAMAYISFYEGFGLPILEGMAAGKAVISSNTSSMPEVGGDAVVYCDPHDKESIVEAMEQVVENESFRKMIENRAEQRARMFSYKKSAEQVLKVLREV